MIYMPRDAESLRQMRGLQGAGLHGHIPDGFLEFKISAKGWRRLWEILQSYAADFDIGKVWRLVCRRQQSPSQTAGTGGGRIRVRAGVFRGTARKVPCRRRR